MKKPADPQLRRFLLEELLRIRRKNLPLGRAQLRPERYAEFRKKSLAIYWDARMKCLQVEAHFDREKADLLDEALGIRRPRTVQ